MKKLIIIIAIIATIFTFGCNSEFKDINSKVKLKSLGSDTTFTINIERAIWQTIQFDSSFVVTSINVSYNEPASIFTTQRVFIAQFVDDNYSSVLQSDTVITDIPNNIYGVLYQTQNVNFDSLNQRCNTLWLWGQPNTDLFTTFVVKGHYSNEDKNEIVTVLLDDDGYDTATLNLNSSYKIKSIKVQHVGRANRSFSIINNDSAINISDISSATNVKNYTLNKYSNSIKFSMTHIPYNDSDIYSFGELFFTVIIEK